MQGVQIMTYRPPVSQTTRRGWKLKRTQQCKKCPWRVETDPHDIPNGYDVAKHQALESTIARAGGNFLGPLHVMACHETDKAHCIGWLVNQIGPGNNIGLRIQMTTCENGRAIKLRGEQHETFEDTLPDGLSTRDDMNPTNRLSQTTEEGAAADGVYLCPICADCEDGPTRSRRWRARMENHNARGATD